MKKPKQLDTCILIEQYQGLLALLQTWEALPAEQRMAARDYIKVLRQRVRQVRVYVMNRADSAADV